MADISPVAPLAFNPMRAQHDVQKVFKDDLALILWLAIKRSHIVSQHFNVGCLRAADEIRRTQKSKQELTAQRLLSILAGVVPGEGIIGWSEKDFAEELLPFVLGDKSIEYRVTVRIEWAR